MPNWKSFQDEAFRLTEEGVQSLTPFILEQYESAIKTISSKLKKVYSDILSGVKPEDYYNTMLKYDRLTKLLDSVTVEYIKASKAAGKYIGQSGELSAANNFYRMQYTHKWLIPGIDFAIIPVDLVQISVYGSTEAYKRYQNTILQKIYGSANLYYPKAGTLSEFLAASRAKEIANIQRAITQGLLTGQNYKTTTKQLSEIIGKYLTKDGVVNSTGAMANSLRIVRTESIRILNDAALINTNYARSQGVDVVRVWNASLDNRTRPAHAALDGKREDNNGMWNGNIAGPGRGPTVGFNVNCRCTTFESINGSMPTLRRGRNPLTGKNEVFEFTDFDEWAKENGLKYNKFGKLVG